MINKPIFSDPPDDLAEDSNTGFLIGGMATCDDASVARGYILAAETLVENVLRSRDHAWEMSYPIIFIYRHAIELCLKRVVVHAPKSHGLKGLIEQADSIARLKTGHAFPQWVRDRLTEFEQVDPTSTAFRYADQREREKLIGQGEYWVELRRLQQVVRAITTGLTRLAEM